MAGALGEGPERVDHGGGYGRWAGREGPRPDPVRRRRARRRGWPPAGPAAALPGV